MSSTDGSTTTASRSPAAAEKGVGVGLFFASYLKNPLKVASIVPSSRSLSRLVASHVDPAKPGWVIELGGGTGPITTALLERGVAPKRFMVLERDPAMAQFLRDKFPDPVIVEGDALDMKAIFEREGVTQVNAVVCGLPLISLPREIGDQIVQLSLESMAKDGRFIQYTYSLFSPLQYERFGVVPVSVKRTLFNVPPAAAWAYGFPGTK
ncbi:MAG: rRNA adenine N-6-methyltransferase family protein [Alphaproteobacteria bacterium]|nr:rRNA adenine N-6-methyltransferase family protein [Alphaproteobacteria bacterium]